MLSSGSLGKQNSLLGPTVWIRKPPASRLDVWYLKPRRLSNEGPGRGTRYPAPGTGYRSSASGSRYRKPRAEAESRELRLPDGDFRRVCIPEMASC